MVEGFTPTPAHSWKGKVKVAGTDLLLPSGNVARVKAMSPRAFLGSGIIPDPLTDIIDKAVHTKRGLPPSKLKEIAADPEKVDATMELLDRVLTFVVIEPAVSMPPVCVHVDIERGACGEYYNVDDRHENRSSESYHVYQEGPRDAQVLYADEVDQTDKLYIFQFSMTGISDLDSFREELAAGMGSVPDK